MRESFSTCLPFQFIKLFYFCVYFLVFKFILRSHYVFITWISVAYPWTCVFRPGLSHWKWIESSFSKRIVNCEIWKIWLSKISWTHAYAFKRTNSLQTHLNNLATYFNLQGLENIFQSRWMTWGRNSSVMPWEHHLNRWQYANTISISDTYLVHPKPRTLFYWSQVQNFRTIKFWV